MLPTRDPSQDKRPTETESEGLETNFLSKRTGKKKQGSNTYIRQNRLQKKGHKDKPRRSLHNTQRKNPPRRHKHCKYIAPNIGAPKYIKKILEDFKKDIDSNTIIVGDFNTPLSKVDKSSKQNIKKDMCHLTIPWMKWTQLIYRELFIPKKQNTHSFQVSMELFQR